MFSVQWDFEEAASTQWRNLSKKQDNVDNFPLQPWTVKPTLIANTPGSHFCYCDKGLVNKMTAAGQANIEKTTSCSKK